MANTVVTVIFAQRFENDRYLFSYIERVIIDELTCRFLFNNILNKSESPQDRQPPTPSHVFDQILLNSYMWDGFPL